MIYKFIFVYLICMNSLFALSDYEWSATIDKKSALVNEAVYIKYTCNFTKDAELYTIDFSPAKSIKNYDLILLKEHNNIYEFVLFVKKAGKINLNFDAIMKKTTLDSIAQMTGGLDDEKAKDGFVSTRVKIKSLSLHVESAKAYIVGEFTVEIKKDKLNKKAFEPFHLEVIIKGKGNFQDIQSLNFDIKDVKIFAQKPIIKTILKKDGYKGTWSQKFAFVSENAFSIPSFAIEYINPKLLNIQSLKSEELHVELSAGYIKEKLLDEIEVKEKFDDKYLFYFIALVFGFSIGKIKFKKT